MAKQIHHSEQETIDCLIARLSKKKVYAEFIRNYEYETRSGCGELDLLAIRNNGVRVYFEIKHHYTESSYNKAIKQFKRAKMCGIADKFVYVTKGMTKRYYI